MSKKKKNNAVVFLKHIDGWAYVKWNDDKVGKTLFDFSIVDELGLPVGQWYKTEFDYSETMLRNLDFKIIEED